MIEAIRQMSRAGARFLVMGGQAMRLVGMPRSTMDWDILVPATDEANFARINAAIEDELDMPLLPVGPKGENFIQTYQTQWGILQFHLLAPGLPSFDEAEAASVEIIEAGVQFRRLSGKHLIESKAAAGRPSDLEDLKFLRELQAAGKLR